MSVFQYSYKTASENFSSSPYSRWVTTSDKQVGKSLMPDRLQDIFLPHVDIHTKFLPTATLFTMGSCFARGLERAAHRAGMKALSRLTQPFVGKDIMAGYANRYNTASILHELEWAAGTPYPDEAFLELQPGRFLDPHSHPVIGSVDKAEAERLRAGLTRYFAQAFEANVFTVTLGLVEGWFDLETSMMLNLNPVYGRNDGEGRKLLDGDRFEFRVMSHAENMNNLEKIYSLIKEHNPKAKIFVTVSPVPMQATFSGRDVAIANMFSKSVLRSCAETWVGQHPDIQYFPSYEMAVLSNPKKVYKEDTVHIQESFVDEIMTHFMNSCVISA